MKRMKSLVALFALIVSLIPGTVACAADATAIPPELRQGSVSCDKATIETALVLKHAGWMYTMPQPKSPQAAWGNRDGRTTWYIGYWSNDKTHATSSAQPKKDDKGELVGDGKGMPAWRRGGSPAAPTKIEWLCSKTGGIDPR
jgi:hypothetical protein